MASEKAIYWTAVGVLALSLGNHFVKRTDGGCLAERSVAAVDRLSAHASHLMAMAGVILWRTSMPLGSTETEVDSMQARLASVDTIVAAQHAACARLAVERARIVASQQLRQMSLGVVCPRQTRKLNVSRPSDGTI